MLSRNKTEQKRPRKSKSYGFKMSAFALSSDSKSEDVLSKFFSDFGYLEPALTRKPVKLESNDLLGKMKNVDAVKLVDSQLIDQKLLSEEWRSFCPKKDEVKLFVVDFFASERSGKINIEIKRVKRIV